MQRYQLPDGRIVTEEMSFELGDVIFPPRAIKFCTPKELEDYEIQVVEPEPEPQPVIDLDRMKRDVSLTIDQDAEVQRMRFITPGSGMAMVYQEKLAQARAYQATGGAPADFPLLAASIGTEAYDLAGVAAVVIDRYTAWLHIGAQIESARLAAKKAVAEASDAETIQAAGRVDWGL